MCCHTELFARVLSGHELAPAVVTLCRECKEKPMPSKLQAVWNWFDGKKSYLGAALTFVAGIVSFLADNPAVGSAAMTFALAVVGLAHKSVKLAVAVERGNELLAAIARSKSPSDPASMVMPGMPTKPPPLP